MNPYKILGLQDDCSSHEVLKAYRRRVKECHPDKGGDPHEFDRVARAYRVLKDPSLRAYYDETGDMPEESTGESISPDKAMLAQLVQSLFTSVEPEELSHENIISLLDQALKRRAEEATKTARELRQRIEALKPYLDRLEYTGHDMSVVHATLRTVLGGLEQNRERAHRDAQALRDARRLLVEYRDKKENENYEWQAYSTTAEDLFRRSRRFFRGDSAS